MKTFFCITLVFITTGCFSQTDRKLSAFASVNVDATQYDRTLSNNAVGFGAGLQLYLRTKIFIRPTIDFNAMAYGGTKELYLTENRDPIYAKDNIITLFGGAYMQATNRLFFTAAGGPAFFNNQVYPGIKAGAGYYILEGRQLAGRICFTNIFQRDDISNKNFGALNFSLALKLF